MRAPTIVKPYIAFTALLLTLCLPLIAQHDTVRVGVELVVVPVSVRDSNGQFVSDLRKEHFHIREDGRLQDIRTVSVDSLPLSVLLLIDTGVKLQRFSIASLNAPIESDDEAAVYGFDQDIFKASSFTNNREDLGKALRMIDEMSGGRALKKRSLDNALLASAADLKEQPVKRRKIIVVISGAGCGSHARSSYETQERLAEYQIQVYGIEIGECFTIPPSDPRALLHEYSDPTGGEAYRAATESSQLHTAFSEIIGHARRQYVLSYISSNSVPGQTAVRRKIEVQVSRPRARVSYRKEYFQYPAIK